MPTRRKSSKKSSKKSSRKASKKKRASSRKKQVVSFKTRSGEKVSFKAKPASKKRAGKLRKLYKTSPELAKWALASKVTAKEMEAEGKPFRISGYGSGITHKRIKAMVGKFTSNKRTLTAALKKHG